MVKKEEHEEEEEEHEEEQKEQDDSEHGEDIIACIDSIQTRPFAKFCI